MRVRRRVRQEDQAADVRAPEPPAPVEPAPAWATAAWQRTERLARPEALADAATDVLDRGVGERAPGAVGPADATAATPGHAQEHSTHVLDPMVAGAAADPFRDTTALARPARDAERPALAPLLTRERAAEVGMYCGAALVVTAVLGIAARLWEDWDGVERMLTSTLATAALILGGIWLRAPWGRPASPERLRGVSVMLTSGVVAAGVGSALLFQLGQSSHPLGGVGHPVVIALALVGVNVVARTAFSETAMLAALAWLGWMTLPAGALLWLGLLGLGAAWAGLGLGLRYARGPRTAAVAGAVLALLAAAALAAQPDAWVARAALAVLTGGALGAFRSGRSSWWLALGAASACALALGTAADALSPAPALLAGGVATMVVSGIALRAAVDEAD